MEFSALVKNELFTFNPINDNTIMVSGKDNSYILYKTSKWNCADDIPAVLLRRLGEIIEEQKYRVSINQVS
jgi:hypothetical protein